MASFLHRLTAHDRTSEAMVGLMVALATRGTFRIATGDVEPVVLALASLSATVAWGVVDAAIFILAAKGARLRWWHVTSNNDPGSPKAKVWIDEALGQTFLSGLDEATRRRIRDDVVAETARASPSDPHLRGDDWLTGLAVLLVVTLAGLPAIVPLLLVQDSDAGAWLSYGVAIALLLGLGAYWGPAHGLPRLRASLAWAGVGSFLTALVLVAGG